MMRRAERAHIAGQLLTEATMPATLGGVGGLALGTAVTTLHA
jgi:hypothetical protein